MSGTRAGSSHVDHLLERVAALGSRHQVERSLKLGGGVLSDQRFVVIFDRHDVQASAFDYFCQQLGMPSALLARFMAGFHDADRLYAGFEASPRGAMYKVYFEQWLHMMGGLRKSPNPRGLQALGLGFKWLVEDPAQSVVTCYQYLPQLRLEQILANIETVFDSYAQGAACALTQQIVRLAATRSPGQSMVYLTAHEEGNPRHSFDVNLLGSDLTMQDLRSTLMDASPAMGLSGEDLGTTFDVAAGARVAHVAGGLSREGQDFLTLYYRNHLP
jgi:tryptophan halogenase